MAYDDTWLVVPVYTEGQVVEGIVRDALQTFPNIVCGDDRSQDDSAECVRRAGTHLVQHSVNLGQGAALRTGINYARSQPGAQYFVTFDADMRALSGNRFIEARDHFPHISRELDAHGWQRAARAARNHVSSQLHALTVLPQAIRHGHRPGIKHPARHAFLPVRWTSRTGHTALDSPPSGPTAAWPC